MLCLRERQCNEHYTCSLFFQTGLDSNWLLNPPLHWQDAYSAICTRRVRLLYIPNWLARQHSKAEQLLCYANPVLCESGAMSTLCSGNRVQWQPCAVATLCRGNPVPWLPCAVATDVRLLPTSACIHRVRGESLRDQRSNISCRAEVATTLPGQG